jgi:MFS family permease
VSAGVRRTFDSLSVPNYRRYFAGQVVSITGNWMQIIAEMWLIVQLTGSGVSVGLTAALQFLPMLLFGAWGGLLADRVPKLRLLQYTQALMALPALTLWALVATGHVTTLIVFALVLARGSVLAIDNPARQAFVMELVGHDRIVNAVALNSVVVHTSRIAGPALAGTVIAVLGVGPCFALNALSFVAMLVALRGMDREQLHISPTAKRAPGDVRLAFRHVTSTPALWVPLGAMVVVGTLSFNFQVLMPLLAHTTWHGTATTYALMTMAMGVGSVSGALATSLLGRVSPRMIVGAATAFGVFELLAAVAPSLPLQILALVPLGAVSVTFAAGVNSSMQLAAAPSMRGRVMSLYSVVFLGSTPIGAPLVGWLAEVASPRAGLALGGAAALVAAAGARIAYAKAMPGATRASTSRGPEAEIASRSASRNAPASSTRVLGTP